jgi:hypothetical protein
MGKRKTIRIRGQDYVTSDRSEPPPAPARDGYDLIEDLYDQGKFAEAAVASQGLSEEFTEAEGLFGADRPEISAAPAGATKDPGLNEEGIFFGDDPKSKKTLNPFDGAYSGDPQNIQKAQHNGPLYEIQPIYNNKLTTEKVIRGRNNTYIILGRDRPNTRSSGYGGKGHTRSGAIDIVVGLQGWAPAENFINDQEGYADKNFGSMDKDMPGDAARIYISQRADIDKYFDICDGSVGQSVADSAIGMKADSVRIMARKGIKLVTGKNPPGRNSIDGKLKITYGIDLIAGNRDLKTGLEQKLSTFNPPGADQREIEYLQPIPKGNNLVEYLQKLHENVQLLNGIAAGSLMNAPKLARMAMYPKTGANSGGPLTVFPGISANFDNAAYLVMVQKQSMELAMTRLKMMAYEIDFLNYMGALYINSRHNRTN